MNDKPNDTASNKSATTAASSSDNDSASSAPQTQSLNNDELTSITDTDSINHQDTNNNTKNNNVSSSSPSSLRHQIGNQFSKTTDIINDNIIIARYATISTVVLLGVYGVANTPLFYRYKHILDIPTRMFGRRRWIHGRIVGIVENKGGGTSNNKGGKQYNHIMQSSATVTTDHPTSSCWDTITNNNSPPSNINAGAGNIIASLLSSSLQNKANHTTTTGSNSRDTTTTSTTTSDTINNLQAEEEHNPIVVLFRHSSPMERLLPQSVMDRVLSLTNTGTGTGKSSRSQQQQLLYSSAFNPQYRNLLQIELAGVVAPPLLTPSYESTSSSSSSSLSSSILSSTLTGQQSNTTNDTNTPTTQSFPLLNILIDQKVKVSLQLLAITRTTTTANKQGSLKEEHNRPATTTNYLLSRNDDDHTQTQTASTAICHVHYRQPKQWFTTTNIALEMVQLGQASINSCGMVVPLSDTNSNSRDVEQQTKTAIIITTTDNFNPTVKQLQQDTKFLSQLEEAEYTAWKEKKGMWSSTLNNRELLRMEYVEEEEYEKNQWSVWGLVKRGWEWLRR